ncbi:MAG: hypothetical protein GY756_21835 [bacterium]|nr:hypothetical protein [bacterium]
MLKKIMNVKWILIFFVLIAILFILTRFNFQTIPTEHEKSSIVSPTDGYVVYNVPYGSMVHKGQLVAEIDPTVLKCQVQQDLMNVKFEHEEYKRYRFLSEKNDSAKEIFEKVEKAYGDSIAKLHIDQAALSHDYQYAPFNGKVTEIGTSTGSGINNGGLIVGITRVG